MCWWVERKVELLIRVFLVRISTSWKGILLEVGSGTLEVYLSSCVLVSINGWCFQNTWRRIGFRSGRVSFIPFSFLLSFLFV